MISLKNVHKAFEAAPAVRDLTLEIGLGEVCCLIGPSGCGKTTTLKMMNRMVEPSSGDIFVDGQPVGEIKPHLLRRKIGYVIQSIGLFPHMTVLQNICIVPRLLKWDESRAKKRGRELLELFSLDPGVFEAKYPHELSGGQAQRIGVARALAADPDILLMDEPFGALDPITRTHLQVQFASIQKELGKTVVLVTHDVDEAVLLGSTVALMNEGELIQSDSPERMLSRPKNDFVRRFFGADRALKRLSRLMVRDVMGGLRELDAAACFSGQPASGRCFAVEEPAQIVWVTDETGRLRGFLDGCPQSSETAQPGGYRDLEDPLSYGLSGETTLRAALTRLIEEGIPCLPVVQETGQLQGELRLGDILRA